MFRVFVFLLLSFPLLSRSQMASIELISKDVPEPLTREENVVKWNAQQPGYQGLNDRSKEFLYWVNFCRSNPERFWDSVIRPVLKAFPNLKGPESESLYKDLLNQGPLPMFALNTSLIRTAQSHATDITSKSARPSHTGTDGTDFGTRIKRAGIRSCASENIAITSQSTLLSVLLLYLDIGLPDKGHRKSLLNPSHKETGIGSAPYGKDQFFFVQDLSCSQ
jgi:hypothetical protein